jgi:squalene cyclase
MNALSMPNPLGPAEPTRSLRSALRAIENPDGGWPFHSGGESRVEPSCWAALALFDAANDRSHREFARLRSFLHSTQLPDGSWPASPGMNAGNWVTSLACLVLSADAASEKNVAAALKWLCEDLPKDSSPFRRFIQALRPKSEIVSQNDSYRGWGWTPKTASWVEPTSFALLAFRAANRKPLPSAAAERRELAVALLYDRMCPGGGWNCGNPRVYGVDGDALVLATSWALLALEDAPEKPGRAMSLNWLEKEFPKMQSPGSQAVALMTLAAYGIEVPPATRVLSNWNELELAEIGTHVLAWACMATNPARSWPPVSKPGNQGLSQ